MAKPRAAMDPRERLRAFPRLDERRRQRAKTLSGGEQQMLAIARGLMTDPDCLIMDEPSEGLAPIIIQGVWQAISQLQGRRACRSCWSSRTPRSRCSSSTTST